MTIPTRLLQLIDEAVHAVRAHPQHDLNLGYRQAIWAALGAVADDPSEVKTIGHRRRSFLANLTICHVLPIWKQQFPNDQTPERILTEAEMVLNGYVGDETALEDFDDYWEYGQELAANSKSMAVAVEMGATIALLTAIEDENFDPDCIDYRTTDSQEFDSNDASFFAAVAYANGPIWQIVAQPKSDSAKRQQFWEWWLTEAVPRTWQMYSKHSSSNKRNWRVEPNLASVAPFSRSFCS